MYNDDWLDSDYDTDDIFGEDEYDSDREWYESDEYNDIDPEPAPNETLFGIDWDDDGKVSNGDDFLSFLTLEDMLSSDKKGSGSCLITLFLLPAYAVLLWLKQRGL